MSTGGGSPIAARSPRQEQEEASDEITEVAADVIRMQLPVWMPGLGHVNMYGLIDDQGIAVVDPGLPGPRSVSVLRKRLRSAGFSLDHVHTIIVTHSHPDHFGAAGYLARKTGARLVTHRAFETFDVTAPPVGPSEAEAAEAEVASITRLLSLDPGEIAADSLPTAGSAAGPWSNPTPWGEDASLRARLRGAVIRAFRRLVTPPEPTHRVRHDDVLTLGGREWRAVYTPGHTPDHLCLFDPDSGALLAGDHVLPTITPHIAGMAEGFDTLDAYLATLDHVAQLPGVGVGLPAHGHPFDDVPGRVEAIKEHHAERMTALAEAGEALGPSTVRALSREVFPERHWGVMAESETFAHLEHLVHSGGAARSTVNGRFEYRMTGAHGEGE
ncbi:MAG: MBL fold metallo-hydrolase [Acidimicrobiia bacterium]